MLNLVSCGENGIGVGTHTTGILPVHNLFQPTIFSLCNLAKSIRVPRAFNSHCTDTARDSRIDPPLQQATHDIDVFGELDEQDKLTPFGIFLVNQAIGRFLVEFLAVLCVHESNGCREVPSGGRANLDIFHGSTVYE